MKIGSNAWRSVAAVLAVAGMMSGQIMSVSAAAPSGAVMEDGVLRYYNSTGRAVVSCVYAIGASKCNGVCRPGVYVADADGALVALNGWRREADGVRVYCDGVPVYAGLIYGEDGFLYYVNSACRAVCGRSYTVSKRNGIEGLPSVLTFDGSGRAYLAESGDGNALYIVRGGDGWSFRWGAMA